MLPLVDLAMRLADLRVDTHAVLLEMPVARSVLVQMHRTHASLYSVAQEFPPIVPPQMMSSQARPYHVDELPQTKSCRAELVDLFASNVLFWTQSLGIVC